jgi:hypothetical protein
MREPIFVVRRAVPSEIIFRNVRIADGDRWSVKIQVLVGDG